MRAVIRYTFIALALIAGDAGSVSAAPASDTTAELRDIRLAIQRVVSDLSEVKRDLREIKRSFDEVRQKRAPTQRVTVEIDPSADDDPIIGNANTPLLMMVFTDLQCGFCARFHKITLPLIRKAFVDTGKLSIIMRDYILPAHPQAAEAAALASCAAQQGRYLEVIDAIFDSPEEVAAGDFGTILQEIPQLNPETLEKCSRSGPLAATKSGGESAPSPEALADIQDGEKIGVMGTPAFFIGKRPAKGSRQSEGYFVRGDQGYESFKDLIQDLLSSDSGVQ